MPSTSDDDRDDRESALQERREDATTAFLRNTPALYRRDITIHPQAAAWADQTDQAPASLFLTGPIGVGKTHTAWQSARHWLGAHITRTGRRPRIETWRSTALFDALRPDNHDLNVRALTRQLQEADLLYIDDLAAARVSPTGWTQERLYEIFDERYINRRPCLITCDVLPGKTGNIVGDRVQSRLREMFRGGVILLEGADRRAGDAA
jgi:chromosomal replication initiation ATPase DnaA